MEALYQLSYSPLRKANITGDGAVRKIASSSGWERMRLNPFPRFLRCSSDKDAGPVAYDQRHG